MNIKNSKGFTLVEILISVVILAMAIVPFIGVFTSGIKGGGVAQKIVIGNNLVQDLMEEIRSKKFDEDPGSPTSPGQLGPEQQESRDNTPPNNFDDVDDYNGYSDSPPEEVDGTVMAEYSEYSRSAIVEYVTEDDFNIIASEITDFKRITVTLTWDGGEQSIIFVTVVGNYARE